MPVPNSMADLSTLSSSNFPTGTEAIGNSLDNYLRAHAAIIRSTNAVSSASIAAASTTNIASSDGESVVIAGSATINSLGAGFAGCIRELRFNGSCSIVSSSNIVLPGGRSISTSPGDVFTFRCTSSGTWSLCSGSRDPGALSIFGGTIQGQISFPSIGGGGLINFYNASNTVVRSYISSDDSSWSLNLCDDSGAYANTGIRVLRSGTKVSLSGLVSSVGSSAAFTAEDRTTSREWSTYSTGDVWRVDAGGFGDRMTVDLSGNLVATGDITSLSDESLKDEWSDVCDGLVDGMAGVLTGEYTRLDTGKRQVGVGARSLQKVLPGVVSIDSSGTASVAYGNAALVGVVALSRRVIELEAKLKGVL